MRHGQTRRGLEGGFSLIEVMVVLAILAALIATGSLLIGVAGKAQARQRTQSRLAAIAAALEQLHAGDQLGYYPPTDSMKMKELASVGRSNDTNIGAETLYLVFRRKGCTILPQIDDADAYSNTDNDAAVVPLADMQKPDLMEYCDSWNNPIVYFSAADYKDTGKVEQYVLKSGETVKVSPKRNESTGEYVRSTSFQLFSMGPDGKPGTEDDIEFGR